MNILDILILVVLGLSLLAGMYKGFIASGLATIGFIGAWAGARMLYARIANLALSNTTLMAVLNQYLEPQSFFSGSAQASMTVTEVVSGGETAIQAAASTVSQKLAPFADAFVANIRNQAFKRLNISTLSEYLDQTVWQAVFNVLAFLLAFLVLYLLISLVVNLLDHVICFPVLRMCDWLVGGLFGLLRGTVFAVLLLCILPSVISLISPALRDTLINGSTLYGYVSQLDFMHVTEMVTQLIG